jgi:two-component system sensor histidine kinase VicK
MHRFRPKSIYPSISTRVTGPFLLTILVVAAIGMFIVTYLVAGSIQERFKNQLLSSADAATNSIVDIERQQLATLRLMAFTKGVSDAIVAHDTAQLDTWLRPIAANAGLDSVVIFDAAGTNILRLEHPANAFGFEFQIAQPIALTDWSGVQNTLAARTDASGDKFADIVPLSGSSPILFITAPVVDTTGKVVGGISVGLSMQTVVRRVASQSLSAIILYSQEGSVLGSTVRTSSEIPPISAQRFADLMNQTQNTSPIDNTNLDGQAYQILYSTFKVRDQSRGLIAVGLPSNFIVERSSTSRDIFGVLFFAMFAGVGFLGLLIARTITRPIARMVETTRAIREGDLSRRVELRTPDELGDLSTSFDHMTAQLLQRNEEVNQLYLNQVQETARRVAVLSSISDALIVQNLDRKIILANPPAEDLLRHIRRNVALRRTFARLCAQPEVLIIPRTIAFGAQFFSVLARSAQLPSGELLGYVIVFRDITPLVEAERLKDEMILQLSHELRTPLTAARGYVDLVRMIESQRISQQGQQFIDNTVGSLLTLERMVNQVVEVSAVIANKFMLDVEQFNVVDVLSQTIDFWERQAEQRDLAFSFFPPNYVICMDGDAKRVNQMVDYLLSNAYNYTLPGGFFKFSVDMQGPQVVFEVVDSGVGIAPDEIDRVFERMYRGRSAEAGPTDARGLGLGLYLTREIVEAHGGQVYLQSQIDVGTVITVRLPLRQPVEVITYSASQSYHSQLS